MAETPKLAAILAANVGSHPARLIRRRLPMLANLSEIVAVLMVGWTIMRH
jgi:hypothetical protein